MFNYVLSFLIGVFFMRALYAWDDYDYEKEIHQAGYEEGYREGYKDGYYDGEWDKLRRH